MPKPAKIQPTLADMLAFTPAEWEAEQARRVAQPAASPAPRTPEQQRDDDADARAFERAMRGRDR